MKSVVIFTDAIDIELKTGPDMCNITPELENLISESKIQTGNLCATMVGSTGSITTIEFESGVVEDLKRAINTLAPPGLEYEHEKAWQDGNGHSHVQAALIGPSIVLPVRNGKLRRGTWQQVVAINHDNRPRTRSVEITMIGTKQD